jgi:hypothetical protein
MSLERFQNALAEARKPAKPKKAKAGASSQVYYVSGGAHLYGPHGVAKAAFNALSKEDFSSLYKTATGKKPTAAALKKAQKEPWEIPDTRKTRLKSFRERFKARIVKPSLVPTKIKMALNRVQGIPLGQRTGGDYRVQPLPPSKIGWEILINHWSKSPKWRFVVDDVGSPQGSHSPIKRDDEAGEAVFRSGMKGLKARHKVAYETLSILAPTFAEFEALQNPVVQEFLVRVNLARKAKKLVKMTGSGNRTPDARLTRDVLQWIASNKLTNPQILATHLFHVAVPAPIRGTLPGAPSEAYLRGKNLVIVPGGDAFDLMPDFWAWTGGPLKKLATLEKKIRLAADRKRYIEKRLPEIEAQIDDPKVKAKADLVTERDALREEMIGVRKLLGIPNKGGAVKTSASGRPIALDTIKVLKTIQSFLKPIGKGFEIKGPKHGDVRTNMPRGFTNVEKKLPKGTRAERLSALQDPTLKGSPLQAKLRKLGQQFRPGDPDAENFHGRLKGVLGKFVRAKKANDAATVKELEAEVDELQTKFFDSQMAKANDFAGAAKSMPKNLAWKPAMNAIKAFKTIASLYTSMAGMGLPGGAGLKAKAKKAADAALKLKKKAEAAYKEDTKAKLKAVKERFKQPATVEKHSAAVKAEAQRRWDALWQGF